MAGVGEVSAIVGLIAVGAKLSKAIIDIAGQYKAAKKQIEQFGTDIGNLGNILDQLHRLHGNDHMDVDTSVRSLTLDLIGQCGDLFTELEHYRDRLYSRDKQNSSATIRARTRWVFESTEVQYLRTRVESMKTNILLMMTMHCVHKLQSQTKTPPVQETAQQVQLLSLQSNACVQRLHTLETAFMTPTSDEQEDVSLDRLSIASTDIADQAQSIRHSILSLYGHQSYYERILEPRHSDGNSANLGDIDPDVYYQLEANQSRASMVIEDYIEHNLSNEILVTDQYAGYERGARTSPDPPTIDHNDGDDGNQTSREGEHYRPEPNTQRCSGDYANRDVVKETPDVDLNCENESGVMRLSGSTATDHSDGSDDRQTRGHNRHGEPGPDAERYRKFRVLMEDHCYEVLPKALKKYNIQSDWKNYDLLLVFGDQERVFALEDEPLLEFKIKDKEAKKPMFMLRKRASPHIWPIPQPLDHLDGQPF